MSYYMRVGDVPRKRHIWHQGDDGRRLAEELMGEEGFNGASSLLYHRHSPSAITGVEAVPAGALAPDAQRSPAALAPAGARGSPRAATWSPAARSCSATATSPSAGRTPTGAASCTATPPATSWSTSWTARPRLQSVFGALEVAAGDYVVIPASTTHRWVVPEDAEARVQALVIEAAGHVSIPARYLTDDRSAARGRPFLRTRPPAAPGTAGRRRGRPGRRAGPHPAGLVPALPRPPPFRRGGLGRLRLPVRPLHPRLRAHRRAASTSRRRCTRPLPVPGSWCAASCPAPTTSIRSRSRFRTTTPTSTPTRCSSTPGATS